MKDSSGHDLRGLPDLQTLMNTYLEGGHLEPAEATALLRGTDGLPRYIRVAMEKGLNTVVANEDTP